MNRHQDTEREVLRRELERGVAEAMDPVNAVAVQGGRAVTTLRSHWLHQYCRVCGHTFRTGDEVLIETDGTVRHQSALLPCAGGKSVTPLEPAEAAAFFRGLDEAWPPPRDLPVHRLEEGDPLLTPPFAGFRRHVCAVCGHTLRLHDHVVLCPCSPQRPICRIAIHRDPLHGLHCWEAWNPGAYTQYCPATSREINA
jgi:hypothetical protein